MENSLLKIQHILDSVRLTKLERDEAQVHLMQIQNKFQELSEKMKEVQSQIEKAKK